MSTLKVLAWKCDRVGCGWVWYTREDEAPKRCARCKSPNWNLVGGGDGSKEVVRKADGEQAGDRADESRNHRSRKASRNSKGVSGSAVQRARGSRQSGKGHETSSCRV